MTTEVWDNDTLAHILLLREQREELREDCFRRRMSSHRQRFKDAASSWLAYECESLEHSKRLESELLHDRKPPVNVRLERSA